MRADINRLTRELTRWFIAALLAAPAAFAAEREAPSAEELDARWIPSVSFAGGVTAQYQESSINSRCELGGPEESIFLGQFIQTRPACSDPLGEMTPADLREPQSEDELAITPLVAATLQLQTPRIGLVPGGPRAFLTGELLTFWALDRDIAKEGTPAQVEFPDNKNDASEFPVGVLKGVGSRLSSEVQILGFGARSGVAFPFEFRGRRLWLKPSFGWLQYEIDVDGIVTAGLKDDAFPGSPGPGIREVRLEGAGSKRFNGIGPGLELELEAGRFGPIGAAVFASADAYKLLGDRTIAFSDSTECFPDPIPPAPCSTGLRNRSDTNTELVPDADIGADSYSASFEFEADAWVYRGMAGIRFHWLGR